MRCHPVEIAAHDGERRVALVALSAECFEPIGGHDEFVGAQDHADVVGVDGVVDPVQHRHQDTRGVLHLLLLGAGLLRHAGHFDLGVVSASGEAFDLGVLRPHVLGDGEHLVGGEKQRRCATDHIIRSDGFGLKNRLQR